MDRRKFVLQSIGVAVGAGLAGSVLTSCGGGDDGGMTGPDGDGDDGMTDFDGTIELTSEPFTFSPDNVEIQAGETVTWENTDGTFHTITPRDPDQDGVWQRQEMNDAGQTFQHTFNTPGTFEYFCEPHESVGMTGTITVVQHQ